ncbi:MAG: serine hydrolase [Bacteroidota bacterium]
MKLVKRLLFILLVLVLVALWYNYPKLNIISGYASKNMASTVYIANRSVASVTQNDNNAPLIKLADATMEENTAMASVFGLMERKSICRPGTGCVLVTPDFEGQLNIPTPRRNRTQSPLPYPYGNGKEKDSLFPEVRYSILEKGLDYAFGDPEVRRTRSVLVLYKDHVIAERYANGTTKETPVLGWSMTKSVLSTLFGILEYKGGLKVNDYAPVASWQSDSRKNITLNNLLRMQSGLSWDEDYGSISDVTRMLFLNTDMTLPQARKQALAAPGQIWNYSSGTSNLLSGILRQQFKTHQEYMDFPYSALIDKIGMHSMLMETDMSGNYVGSSYAWGTTRDWARFGLLYLNRGDWNGTRLFSENWVDYVTRPTPLSNGTYGAHFWLNAEGKYPNIPKDLFSANGFQGQRVFILPSKNLVIVRTGLAENPDFDFNAFLEGIVSAFP